MATNQKKKTTSRAASGTQKKSTAAKKKNTTKSKAELARKEMIKKRTIGCIVCTVLALLICATYFNAQAIVLSIVAKTLKGLFGYGYWLAGPALVMCAILLLNHEDPVRKRVISVLLMPGAVSGLLHIFIARNSYTFGTEMVKELWKDGTMLYCGGVIPGSLTVGLIALVSQVVTAIFYLVLILILFILAFRVSPKQVIEDVRENRRLHKEYEQVLTEEWENLPKEFEHKTAVSTVSNRASIERRRPGFKIDIPLDDDQPKEIMKPSNKSLYRKGEVSTPAQIVQTHAAEIEEIIEPVKPVVPPVVHTPIPAVTPLKSKPVVAPVQEEEKKPVNNVMKREELDNEREEISKEIEENQAEPMDTYRYPPVSLLDANLINNNMEVGAELRSNSQRLASTLTSFGVDAEPGEVVHGPSVTRYEFKLDQGVKLSKITNLSDDIALALGASSVRVAPVPGKISAVGIEVPNKAVTMVKIRDVVESNEFSGHTSNVAFTVGKDIAGNNIVGNIAKLPHVLIAGTTGSGKSVCTNSLIISILYKSSPEDVRFIMVDPKMVELAPYNGIPHLLIPVVTDPKKAAGALQWAVFEMMKRYKTFSENGVKDLKGFNALALQGTNPELKKLPSVVVVIDELADLMMIAAKEVEESICRVAQMGRAAGVHLVIATQRPSADVITGLMKANIPSRIAFAVASSLESRIILDTVGAEKLVGHGDMLYFPLGDSKPTRVQGCFITPEEIERVVAYVKEGGGPQYDQTVMDQITAVMEKGEKNKPAANNDGGGNDVKNDADDLLPEAVNVILETGQASVSMLQRRLKLGYSRAARLVDQMEERGIVGPFEGSKPRQILINKEKWQEMQMKNSTNANEEPRVEHEQFTIMDVMESHDALD